MQTLVGALPGHRYVWVDATFLGAPARQYIPAVWFGLVSYPGRAWGCTVMLDCGAIYRNLPPHALAFHQTDAAPAWTLAQAQTWDCYGMGWTALTYPFLEGLSARVRCGDTELAGAYLFTVAPVGDVYSAAPAQAKEFVFLQTRGHRLTIQPTNHVLFRDPSFTSDAGWPTWLRRQTDVYSSETSTY